MRWAQSWSTLSLGQKCPLQPDLHHGVVLSWCFHHLHVPETLLELSSALTHTGPSSPSTPDYFWDWKLGDKLALAPWKAALSALGFCSSLKAVSTLQPSQQGTRDEGTCEAEPTESICGGRVQDLLWMLWNLRESRTLGWAESSTGNQAVG